MEEPRLAAPTSAQIKELLARMPDPETFTEGTPVGNDELARNAWHGGWRRALTELAGEAALWRIDQRGV